MNSINVAQSTETADGWDVRVMVDDTEYAVHVPREYYAQLTQGGEDVGSLVRRSFEFLLARESKEAILRSFALPVIEQYFPEYPEDIKLRG